MTIEMQPPVKLKGVGDGFWVTLDPSVSEDKLIKDVTRLFERLKHLTINARVVLDTGDARGCESLIANIGAFLKNTFYVGVVTTPPAKRSAPLERIRQRDLSKGWTQHKSEVLMLRGRVRSGQKIKAKKHIVIIGNVNPGAEISAGGNIIVMGRLMGQVHAGYPDNEESVVLALDFRPTQIQIGGVVAAGIDENSDAVTEFASVDKGRIIVQDFLKAEPFGNIPWPEVI